MPEMHVHIRGDGLAAWCCARLLTSSGFRVSVEKTQARKPPLILINPATQALLGELAGDSLLFDAMPQIRKRIVSWGSDTEARVFDHSAAIVSEAALLGTLWTQVSLVEGPHGTDWTVSAAAPAEQLRFGSRTAWIAEVQLHTARETCWTESLEHGWLFLIAGNGAEGSLIATGAPTDQLLESSRIVAPEISAVTRVEGPVAAYPRITPLMSGDTWLACGTAAMALDPLCGDGSGHALREAILAVSVLRAIAKGSDPVEVLEHYEARLRLAFERHLQLCEGFYGTGGNGPWWQSELALLRDGLQWTRAHATTRWRYRLNGFDLLRTGA